ncbi:hypothetical protein VNO77_00238 [Canavalia gladiata]|uniref:Uncharacterized protein n=1 Tax=Canavalia gladiata TaxID=3824 RepID=A0AAN9R478_CANGL
MYRDELESIIHGCKHSSSCCTFCSLFMGFIVIVSPISYIYIFSINFVSFPFQFISIIYEHFTCIDILNRDNSLLFSISNRCFNETIDFKCFSLLLFQYQSALIRVMMVLSKNMPTVLMGPQSPMVVTSREIEVPIQIESNSSRAVEPKSCRKHGASYNARDASGIDNPDWDQCLLLTKVHLERI